MKKSNNISKAQNNNVEVYTLTCTWAPSYGAVLQAYALAKKINNLGLRAKIINYQPNYYNLGPKKGLLAPLYEVRRCIFERLYLEFLSKSGMITKTTYNNMADLRHASLDASVFIVGSDQVWNCIKYFNGKDDAMFLDFAKSSAKRVSYAASLAMPEVPRDQIKRYKKMLDKFDSISVREKTGTEALAKIGISNAATVIDPVYLLNQSDWLELSTLSTRNFTAEKYILIICLEERDNIYEYARKKAATTGAKIYSFRNGMNIFRVHKSIDKCFWNISVYDYLNIINNAEAVVTDSFHAMSFSLIFNRDVDIITRGDYGNSRMVDLLNDLEISERVTDSRNVITEKINYTEVNQRISDKVIYATEFLKNSMKDRDHEQ